MADIEIIEEIQIVDFISKKGKRSNVWNYFGFKKTKDKGVDKKGRFRMLKLLHLGLDINVWHQFLANKCVYLYRISWN